MKTRADARALLHEFTQSDACANTLSAWKKRS